MKLLKTAMLGSMVDNKCNYTGTLAVLTNKNNKAN